MNYLLLAVSLDLLNSILRRTTSTELAVPGPSEAAGSGGLLSVCWSTAGELCHSQHYGQH